jgi:hypothetical protein
VDTPKSWLRAHQQTLLEQGDWQQTPKSAPENSRSLIINHHIL